MCIIVIIIIIVIVIIIIITISRGESILRTLSWTIRPMLYQTELPELHPAHTWNRTKDLHILSQTLTQLCYMGTYKPSPRNW